MNQWGCKLRTKFWDQIETCRQNLEAIHHLKGPANVAHYTKIQEKLNLLIAKEESYWRQRSKVFWLREGDINSKFFHSSTKARKTVNKISSLSRDDGVMVHSHKDMSDVVVSYFSNFFQANDNCIDILPIINNFPHSVSFYNNDILLSPFTLEEFRVALFHMNSQKSLDPSGLKTTFYKIFWHLCGPEVFYSSITWLETGSFPPEVNATTIVLIPKTRNPTCVKEFCPISLWNVIYKIISKVLANHPKTILPNFISQEQLAFMDDHSILDNAFLAFEIIHHMRCK